MNEAIVRMLGRYECRTVEEHVRALREILQEIALLGLWRNKFFDKVAFYGGTALRILYGMDRFSEDLDFSLLRPMPGFKITPYVSVLAREIRSFGFDVDVTEKERRAASQIQSAFLKANTMKQLLVVEAGEGIAGQIPRGQVIKIKIEVDTDPPPGFDTENKFLLQPIPFSVRTFVLPDHFAGKMHAVLCRQWKNRVKGRDWYDMVWYASNHPQLHLGHLEKRMMQTGHLERSVKLTSRRFFALISDAVDRLDVQQAKREVEPFVKNPETLQVWSKKFFREVAKKIVPV